MKTKILLMTIATATSCCVAAAADEPQATAKTAKQIPMTSQLLTVVSVRYMIDDVHAAVAFYTNHLGFTLEQDAAPAFASVIRGNLRLLLSGEKSSGRLPLPDGTKPVPGGWNRIELTGEGHYGGGKAASQRRRKIPS